jgi:hypothetical protein
MRKGSIIVLSTISFITIAFFAFFYPFLILKIPNLDGLRNYFTAYNAICTSVIGITGAYLGAYYYFDKERKNKVQYIINALNEYDDHVMAIIDHRFRSQHELDLLRQNVSRMFEPIEMIIDKQNSIFSFSDSDAKKILDINNFVDKSELLMRTVYIKTKKDALIGLSDTYNDKLRAAKELLFSKTM